MEYKAWIVVADSARARILGANKPSGSDLAELEVRYHPESRMKNGEIYADKPGRMQSMQGKFRTAAGQAPAHELEAERFARSLAEYLDKSHHQKKFDRLVLVASPNFLGNLRNEADGQLQKAVANEINKDLSHLEKMEDIRKHLPDYLW
jgi:protein required for attachment to host cells